MLVVAPRHLRLGNERAAPDDALAARRQRVERLGIRRDRVGDGPGVDQERLQVQVVHRVADAVVVLVVRHARRAAIQRRLRLRLDLLRPREQPARRDAHVQERPVVGAPAELGRLRRQLLAGEVSFEQRLRLGRSRGAAEVEGRPVAVVDAEEVVGRRDHVEVEVQPDLVQVLGRRLVDVVLGTEQTELLSRPPCEAHRVVDLVLGQLQRYLQDADRTGAVVVDAGTRLDRVGVSAHEDDVVGVAGLGLGNDVHTVGCVSTRERSWF